MNYKNYHFFYTSLVFLVWYFTMLSQNIRLTENRIYEKPASPSDNLFFLFRLQ